MSIGILILAAGNSSRLGQPKQLLPYLNGTLIEHVVFEARTVSNVKTIVVTGATHKALLSILAKTGVELCFNPDWKLGMASSIKAGLAALLASQPDVDACILTVCDQPYLRTEIFNQLITLYLEKDCGIVASQYGQTLGTPVLFNKRFFSDLQKLQGQEGAKRILNNYKTNVCVLPFLKGEIDIDTMEDYVKFIASEET